MTRPKFNDEMAMELAKTAAGYLNADEDDKDAMAAIAKVLLRHHDDNGFELGKEFEDEGYDIDMSTVSDLDCLSSEADDILNNHIKRWVVSENIELTLSPFDVVELKRPINKEHYGWVHDLRKETAQYGVRIKNTLPSDTSCYIINCEDLILIPPEQAK